jgi:CBS domain-containing protein
MDDMHPVATVEEVMSRLVTEIDAGASVAAAAERLYEVRIGSVVVTDDDGPFGIVTERDVVGVVAADDPRTTPVGEIASEPPITVARSTRIEEAAARMEEHAIKTLPVTDEDGGLAGIVTTTDVSNYFPTYHPGESSWS